MEERVLRSGLWHRRGPPKIDRADYVRDDFKLPLNTAILFLGQVDPVYRRTSADFLLIFFFLSSLPPTSLPTFMLLPFFLCSLRSLRRDTLQTWSRK